MSAAVASSSASVHAQDPSGWGGNFWVTLADPQSGNEFYACPSTGETSWEPPEGHFVLPRTDAGEWWEIDDAETGVPYYYHTVRGETSWQRPEGEFVIPLHMIQNTTMGKRLSAAFMSNRASLVEPDRHKKHDAAASPAPAVERLTPPATPTAEQSSPATPPPREQARSASRSTQRTKDSVGRPGSRVAFAEPAVSVSVSPPSPHMRTRSSPASPSNGSGGRRISTHRPPVSGHPIPLSVDVNFGAGGRQPFSASASNGHHQQSPVQSTRSSKMIPTQGPAVVVQSVEEEKAPRPRTKSSTQLRQHMPAHAGGREEGSLLAAAERIARTNGTHTTSLGTPVDSRPRTSFTSLRSTSPPPVPIMPGRRSESASVPPMPVNDIFYSNSKASASSTQITPTPSPERNRTRSGTIGSAGHSAGGSTLQRPMLNGRTISSPVLDHAAAQRMAPVVRGGGAVFVERREPRRAYTDSSLDMAGPGHRGFPQELKEDIEQFAGSDFARRYFATHSTGLIFKRKTPLEKVMTWQREPLTTPLLNLTQRALHRDAIKMFRAVQKVMGDLPSSASGPYSLREEQRWLLSVCLLHGELRDEAYCQVVKQLRANSNPQSVFQGWQLLCVLLVTFPPSKDFEAYLQGFLERHTGQTEGRVDVMARYCLKRLPIISRKGPRGRTLTVPEIESASDAAFNPSTFGEPLDAIMRLQSRTYPDQKVPIVLPFLADAILALGGTRTEGIFRVPGDGDAVASLKLRIDRGFYTLDGIEDPHVPASLLKLWLRELQTPLVPDEMYNECVSAGASDDSVGSVQLVARLPSHHRRVMVFVVSFLQLFLEERAMKVTKMTAANMALVMAPNLVRCASESVKVVFANAEHEQRFVWNLLVNLQCDAIDPEYRPTHGRGAGSRGKQRAG